MQVQNADQSFGGGSGVRGQLIIHQSAASQRCSRKTQSPKYIESEFVLPVKALCCQFQVRVVVQVARDEVLPLWVDQVGGVYHLEHQRGTAVAKHKTKGYKVPKGQNAAIEK